MDIGATLRRAREEKRLTLDQLSRATKISVSSLRALENNDFDRLPAMVYTRGFLRAYASEVGLDPGDIVEHYLHQVDEALAAQVAEAEAREPAPSAAHDRTLHPDIASALKGPLRIEIDLKDLPRPALTAAAAVLVVASALFLIWRSSAPEPVATAEAVQEPAATPAAAPANDAAHATNMLEDGLRVELKTSGPCWVSASADRAPVLARLLQAGESETIDAENEFVLRVGDPSTLTVTINGETLRPLGRSGIPVTVHFTRHNYREYVAG